MLFNFPVFYLIFALVLLIFETSIAVSSWNHMTTSMLLYFSLLAAVYFIFIVTISFLHNSPF